MAGRRHRQHVGAAAYHSGAVGMIGCEEGERASSTVTVAWSMALSASIRKYVRNAAGNTGRKV